MLGCQTKSAVLALDKAVNPSSWISVEAAIHLFATDRVIARLGEQSRVLYGGTNRVSGLRSSIEVNSILLTRARVIARLWADDYVPPLTNRALFERDSNTCQYCGESVSPRHLTRDHVIPRGRVAGILGRTWSPVALIATASESGTERRRNGA